MNFKSVKLVEAKAEGDGAFTALASVFGNVDKGGDRMMPGAFRSTLAKWRASGKPIPIILSHQWDDPMKYVGKADPREVFEDDRGLVVRGTLDTGDAVGAKVHKLMKERLLTGWSFGYSVPEGGQRKKNGINEVFEVELFETGPTLVGMNSEAELQDVKSALEIGAPIAAEPKLTEEQNEILRGLRQEWEAEREAKAAAEAEEKDEARRRRLRNFPERPKVLAIIDGQWGAFDPEDVGYASDEQIAARTERLAAEAERARLTEEARKAAFERAEPTISVCGVRVTRDRVIVDD